MIVYSGFGIYIVAAIYAICFWLMTKVAPQASETQQIISLFITLVISTVINFVVSMFLNKTKVKHKVFGVKLEYAVLVIGFVLGLLLLVMVMNM